jgi:hypothetical protein
MASDMLTFVLGELAAHSKPVLSILDDMLNEKQIDAELERKLDDFENPDLSDTEESLASAIDAEAHLDVSHQEDESEDDMQIMTRSQVRARKSISTPLHDGHTLEPKRGLINFSALSKTPQIGVVDREKTPPPRATPFSFGSGHKLIVSSSPILPNGSESPNSDSADMDLDDLA